MSKIFKRYVFLFLFLMLCSSNIFAAGISTNLGEVFIQNLKLGETYSVRELAKIPFKITSTMPHPIELHVKVLVPALEDVKSGYEPVPDPSWVKVTPDLLSIMANKSVEADIQISIPPDKQYIGKKYEAFIWSYTTSGVVGLGLRSRLLFSISGVADITLVPQKNEQGQIVFVPKKTEKPEIENMDFSVLPMVFKAEDIKLGKKINLSKYSKQTLKIKNDSTKENTYNIKSITVNESLLTKPDEGYEDTPNPAFLFFSDDEIVVPAKSEKEVKLYVNIPKEDKYKNKKYQFMIHTTLAGQKVPVGFYSRLFVTTVE